jgi:HAD superfamily hydrolase (TIGR01549 family)
MTTQPLQALFFDFDGVLVDSNSIKVQAFYELFKGYDRDSVKDIIAYHRQHGGISRVVKISHAFEHILKIPLGTERLKEMARNYSQLVMEQVIAATSIAGADDFLAEMHGQLPIFVISGTPQEELRLIIHRRNQWKYFDEIVGSPIQKPEHIKNLLQKYNFESKRCMFIGDASTDLHAARACNMPFIGIQGDFEFPPDVLVLPDCTELKTTITRKIRILNS